MANDLTSNITRKLMREFLKAFESNRVVTKTVNTQLFAGKFTPASGDKVDIKRPHDYTTIRTAGGDIGSDTKDDITAGKATAEVQDYFTAATEWGNVEEALELDQLDTIIAPMARRIVTDLETDFTRFMAQNVALTQGEYGEAIDSWSEVANAGALMASIGIPSDMPWYYLMSPYAQVAMSSIQHQLSSVDSLVQTAWTKAQISRDFGGLRALTSTALPSITVPTIAAAIGTIDAVDVTYLAAKDTMQQTLRVDGITAGLAIPAGTPVSLTSQVGADSLLLSQSTREQAQGEGTVGIAWSGVIAEAIAVTSVTDQNIVVSSPAIHETLGAPVRDGAYNSVTAPLAIGDTITIEGSGSTLQPNLFYHPQAFSMASVKLPKLFSTDTTVTTEDGFSLRVSKYSDGDANQQKVRFDLLPAYAALNPWFAGQGWGAA